MVKWCGNCGHKMHECDNAMYMECTSQPFKLWTPDATCNNCGVRGTDKCSKCVIGGMVNGVPSEWRPIEDNTVTAERIAEAKKTAEKYISEALEAKADAVKPKAGMSSTEFERLMEEQIERSRNVLCYKAKEYATQDRLHNFRVAAGLQGCTPIQALSGMMAKHTVSVYDMCESGKAYPIDLWQEKITDSINYLLILNAMVREGS